MNLETAKAKARAEIKALGYSREEQLNMERGMLILADILEGEDWKGGAGSIGAESAKWKATSKPPEIFILLRGYKLPSIHNWT